MTYLVQIFTRVAEDHLTKEMNKMAAQGWRVISTAIQNDRLALVVTWGKES